MTLSCSISEIFSDFRAEIQFFHTHLLSTMQEFRDDSLGAERQFFATTGVCLF